MIILSDLDDVGAEWSDGFDAEAIANWSHIPGIPMQPERMNFRFYDGQPDEIRAAILGIFDSPGFYSRLQPTPGWVDAMHEMEDEGHTVRIVTSPWHTNPTCLQDKADWVAKHLGEGWRSKIIFTSDKTFVRGDILVDDKPKITGAMEPTWEHVMFDRIFNQDVPNRRLMQWSDWREVLLYPTWQ